MQKSLRDAKKNAKKAASGKRLNKKETEARVQAATDRIQAAYDSVRTWYRSYAMEIISPQDTETAVLTEIVE